jgi:NAD dependent epimerase/dehydratase family enzyme
VSNREFSKALGRALHRPAIAPVPGFALKLLYGGMAKLVLEGQHALPRRATELGYRFRHPQLDEALQSALTTTRGSVVKSGR